jgi:hypothetical protein
MSPTTIPGKMTLAKEFTWNETVWNPSMLSTALWLDAADASTITESGGAVSQWDDKSGNSRNVTQATAANQPTYTSGGLNQLPVVTYGGDDFLSNTIGFQPYRSAAIVYRDSSSSTVGNVTPLGSVFGGQGGSYHGFDDNTQIFSVLYTDPKTLNGQNYRNGASIGDGLTTARPSSVCIQTHVATGNLTQPLTVIGADNANSSARAITGIIAEVIISPLAWSSLERQKIEGYLAHKWGLTANLPAGHPYKLVGPTP